MLDKMTQKQKRTHIEYLRETLENEGFKEDRYGNYKLRLPYPDAGDRQFTLRAKLMRNNLRIEIRHLDSNRWVKIVSAPLTRVSLGNLTNLINKYKGV